MNNTEEDVVLYGSTFKGAPAMFVFSKNKRHEIKRIMVSMEKMTLLGSGIEDLKYMLQPHYGNPLPVDSKTVSWTFRNGQVLAMDSKNPSLGLVIVFTDKKNKDPED